ncbi:MAG: 30S ribosomal protein S2 [Chitinophagales bacterium]|jgi:small subunit ribosomal protein S2
MNEQTLTAKQTQEVERLFQLGAHLGHKKNRLHPKARKYIYKIVNGVSIIDLTKTVTYLDSAKALLKQYAKEGKTLLVVVTKKVANHEAFEICKANDIPSITTKWLPGLLTNFETIMKNVKKLQTYKDQQTTGEWEKFVKHERIQLSKEMTKLEKLYGGLLQLKKKPDAMFIVDIKKEKNAVTEAKKNNLPIIAVVDTNSNPDQVDVPIVVNDDSPAVVQSVIQDLLQTYIKGRKDSSEK